MRIAPEALPFVLPAAAAMPLAALWPGPLWALLPAALGLFILSFFRDPRRTPPVGLGQILSPADGRVVAVHEVEDHHFPDGRARRISIFLSIFNVHVNRSPVSGTVRDVRYSPGRFRAAFHGKASEENERNRIDIDTADGPIAVTQIAGAVARRIICDVVPGQALVAGQRFGIIRFGSRVDLFVPVQAEIAVGVGDRVRSSLTVLARRQTPAAHPRVQEPAHAFST